LPGSQDDQVGVTGFGNADRRRRAAGVWERNIEGFPEPTWEGALRRRADFPPWTDKRLTIDSVNSREANLQAGLDYLSADRL
jgi:hypothetical protein